MQRTLIVEAPACVVARAPAKRERAAVPAAFTPVQLPSPLPTMTVRRVLPEQGIEPPEDFKETVCLPPEAETQRWSRFERDLYLQSHGAYHPGVLASRRRGPPAAQERQAPSARGTGSAEEVRGRVSVVVPTMCTRQRYHEQLWSCFLAQDWPDKELVVVESYRTTPSAFLQSKAEEDSRLVLVSLPIGDGEDFNVGLKRDMTLHLATGEYVANFDDDDIYAPTYVSCMVAELCRRGLVALTLSSWHNYYERRGICGYYDPAELDDEEEKQRLEGNLYGFGFSYVHLRREALAMPYPNLDFAEDAPFMLRLRDTLGEHRVGLIGDQRGLCLHIVHSRSTTVEVDFVHQVPEDDMQHLQVYASSALQKYLNEQAHWCVRLWVMLQRCS